MKLIKENKIYIIIAGLIIGFFTWSAFTGRAYWQDTTVTHNAGYTGPVPHSGYGVRFYHK
ncbi:MAG: hypothetical protein JO080_15045 [Mucilaginibacter sp.]|nr:hypothetical protein [Mucilaginibacter sp.]